MTSAGLQTDLSSHSVSRQLSGVQPRVASGEQKAPTAFRTISEVANSLDVPQHVLRFWETKFQQVKPLKRGGGRRYYRPEDVDLLTQIKDLLYTQGMTIRGVQKILRESGKGELARLSAAQPATFLASKKTAQSPQENAAVSAQTGADSEPPLLSGAARREVERLLEELKSLRALLRQTGV